jgi:hypothetical protein
MTTLTTTTVTQAAPAERVAAIVKRDGVVPSYASACSGSARYSSACSCFGVTRATVTAPIPV